LVGLIDLRNRLKAGKPSLTEADIQAAEMEIRRVFLGMDHNLHHPPDICNTDGDPLEPHKLVFEIDSPERGLAELASLSVTESKEEILRNARYNEDGGLQRVEWDWSRPGHKQSTGMSNTILGNLTIDQGRLTVQVNSVNRAKKIRKTIEKRLGDAVRFKMDEITPFRPKEVWEAAQDPDEIIVNLKYHLLWNAAHRRPVFTPPKSYFENVFDLFLGFGELVGGLPALMWLAPDHVHIYVETDGEKSLEAITKKLKAASSKAILEQFRNIKEKLPNGGRLWDKVDFHDNLSKLVFGPLTLIQFIQPDQDFLHEGIRQIWILFGIFAHACPMLNLAGQGPVVNPAVSLGLIYKFIRYSYCCSHFRSSNIFMTPFP
jgi:REP element-mobilizing transposase RayT